MPVVWLTALWMVLWRDPSLGTFVAGAAVAAAVVGAVPGRHQREARHSVRPAALAAFVGFFAWKLVEANLVLAREIVTRKDHLQRGIVAIAVPDTSDLVATIVANAITLTPGTVTLESRRDPRTLYVHVLHLRDVEAVRRDVHRLQSMAARAFPTRHHDREPTQ